jgi:hypothetical protein
MADLAIGATSGDLTASHYSLSLTLSLISALLAVTSTFAVALRYIDGLSRTLPMRQR